MSIPFVAFVILLGWGLYDGDIYPTEGGIYAAIWLAFLLGFFFLKVEPLWLVVPTVLLDIVLILKVFGQDIRIR